MAYGYLPWTILSAPYLTCGFPMILKSLAVFGAAALAAVSWAAAAESSP